MPSPRCDIHFELLKTAALDIHLSARVSNQKKKINLHPQMEPSPAHALPTLLHPLSMYNSAPCVSKKGKINLLPQMEPSPAHAQPTLRHPL